MNRATFFRHFAEKREVLFGGEDVLSGLFADAIQAAFPDATLIECLQAAFAEQLRQVPFSAPVIASIA